MELCESNFLCSVCNELLVKATGLQCGHIFCLNCVKKWRQSFKPMLDSMLHVRKATCPICRTEIMTQAPLKTVDSFLEKAVEIFFNDEAKKSRKELLSLRAAPIVAPIATPASASSQFLQVLYSIQGRGRSRQLISRIFSPSRTEFQEVRILLSDHSFEQVSNRGVRERTSEGG